MGHRDPTTALRGIGQVEYNHGVMLSLLPRISFLRRLDFCPLPQQMEEWGPGDADDPPMSPHHLGPDSIVLHASLCFQTANLSRAGLCLFHLLPQHGSQSLEPRVIRGCLLMGKAETGESICSSDPRRSPWHRASFQEEHLAWQSSRSVRPAWPPASPCLAAGGPRVGWKMRSLRSLPRPRAHSLFNEMLFSNVFPGSWCGGFFLYPLFLPGPWAWLQLLWQRARSKVPGG